MPFKCCLSTGFHDNLKDEGLGASLETFDGGRLGAKSRMTIFKTTTKKGFRDVVRG